MVGVLEGRWGRGEGRKGEEGRVGSSPLGVTVAEGDLEKAIGEGCEREPAEASSGSQLEDCTAARVEVRKQRGRASRIRPALPRQSDGEEHSEE